MTTRCIAFIASLLAPCFLVAEANAQFPGPGLTWMGGSGNNAGSFVPSCTISPVSAARGEGVDLRTWGDPKAPFVVLAAASASQCLPFPGLGNALVLDLPLIAVSAGILTESSPCLSCPAAFKDTSFTIPRGVPSGVSVSFQAVSFGGGSPSFTVAITATIT